MEEKDLMDVLRQQVRRALQLAIGAAIATALGGALSTAVADQPSSMRAMRLPADRTGGQHYTPTIPAPYRADTEEAAAAEAVALEGANEWEGADEEEAADEPSLEEQFEDFKSQLSEMEESIDEVAEVAGNKSIVDERIEQVHHESERPCSL